MTWKKLKDFMAFAAALLTCWTLISNPGGILDIVISTWPTVGKWLPVTGIVFMLLFGSAYAASLILDFLRGMHSRKQSMREKRDAMILSNLHEIFSLVGRFDPDGTDRARADIILHKLVMEGIIDQKVRNLRGEDVHPYVATVMTAVEKFGVDFAKINKNALIGKYLAEKNTNIRQH